MSTYVPIQAITLSATASSIEFTGIPQTYTDLVVVLEAKTSALVDTCIRYNGDTGTNYSFTRLFGNGSTASSNRNSSFSRILMGDSDTGASMVNTIHIQNYSNTTTNKTTLVRSNKTDRIVFAIAALWRNTAAITSMTLFPDSGTWSSGSTFTLYGVGSGSPKAFGGDEVRTDGTYWYHIFNSSGRFEPVENLNVDYLVIAGGGGGGNLASGGGAGGYRTATSFSVTNGLTYTVTVGAGGAGSTNFNNNGTSGGSSSFSTISSSGGGGAGRYGVNGLTGGSGGGGGGNGGLGGTGNSGSYSPSEGSSGGNGHATSTASGGGGGASAAGGAATSSVSGNGGAGTASSITGSSVTRAGGGGGSGDLQTSVTAGTGGTGGGGAGVAGGAGVSGTANTGGGGGGGGRASTGGATFNGGNGGSGIVVLRYGV